MGRKPVYRDATERKKAQRARMAMAAPPTQCAQTGRKVSRPSRLHALEATARILLQEYQSWLESLPDSLEGTTQAEALIETIERLEQAVDLLGEIVPPRGFGRD
jgi:hypothetical protein